MMEWNGGINWTGTVEWNGMECGSKGVLGACAHGIYHLVESESGHYLSDSV